MQRTGWLLSPQVRVDDKIPGRTQSSIMKVLSVEVTVKRRGLVLCSSGEEPDVYLGSLDWFLLSGAPAVLCADTKANFPSEQTI